MSLIERHHAEFVAFDSMRQRCNNPKAISYPNYGARGITIDPAWDHFAAFIRDMGPRPPGTSIDRIDNDAGYCKSNCRWATRETQMRNTRVRKDSVSGVKGVNMHSCGRWRAYLCLGPKMVSGGYHDNIDDAIAARKELERIHWPASAG